MEHRDDTPPLRVRLPADVERPDRIVFNLTARQLVILTGTGLLLYTAWTAVATVIPPPVFLIAALPIAAGAMFLAVGRRDGVSIDRWLLAAIRHHRSSHHLIGADGPIRPAPAWITGGHGDRLPLPAPLRLPARGITADGVIDLGPDGHAVAVAASTVAFGLRSPSEQNSLVAGFGRWLNSLDGPTHIHVRAQRIDMTVLADQIAEYAPGLPHPALEHAATAHAAFLDRLATERELLHRQVTIVLRDTRGTGVAQRRATDAVYALAGCDVTARTLDGPQTAVLLRTCLDPAAPPPAVGSTTRDALTGSTRFGGDRT